MDQLWTNILNFVNQLVSPDWGSLVALIPLVLLLGVLAFVAWLVVRFATAGPTRRGIRKVSPRPPAGVHAAAPSYAPVIGAIGVFLLFYGIIFQGWVLVVGVTALIASLVYWLREGIRDYEHVVHAEAPAVAIRRAPPPGVHVPPPTFRPILASVAMFVLFYGLVFGGWLLAAGVAMLVISLLQWLMDARREYRGVVVADTTGHLPSEPAPRYPTLTIAAFAILFIGAIVLNAGILPPKSSSASTGGAAASGAPASPAAGGSPSGGAPGPGADVTITAEGVAFTTTSVTGPAGKDFTIKFENKDAGTPHNVDIHKDSATGASVFKGDIFPGVDTKVYQVKALDAGTYTFTCDVHPAMTGTLTVK